MNTWTADSISVTENRYRLFKSLGFNDRDHSGSIENSGIFFWRNEGYKKDADLNSDGKISYEEAKFHLFYLSNNADNQIKKYNPITEKDTATLAQIFNDSFTRINKINDFKNKSLALETFFSKMAKAGMLACGIELILNLQNDSLVQIAFKALFSELPLSDNIKFEVLVSRIKNKNLAKKDLLLFADYFSAFQKKQNINIPKERIIRRMIDIYSEALHSYTGKENFSNLINSFNAMSYLAESINLLNQKDQQLIAKAIHSTYLASGDRGLLENYKHDKSENNKKSILDKIREYSGDWYDTIFGSKSRRNLFYKRNALKETAKTYGISKSEIEYAEYDFDIYKPFKAEFFFLSRVNESVNSPEKKDDRDLIIEFKNRFIAFSRLYFKTITFDPPPIDKILILGSIYDKFELAAMDLGIPLLDIKEIEKKERDRSSFKGESTGNKGHICIPEKLPSDIKDTLSKVYLKKGYSYFDFVKDNVSYIIFTNDYSDWLRFINIGGNMIGGGVISLHVEQYSVQHLDKSYLLEVIIHEANHCAWHNRNLGVKSSVIKQGLSCEADAYNSGINFYKNAKKQLPDDPRFKNIGDRLDYISSIVQGISEIIGSNNFINTERNDIDTDLPPRNTPQMLSHLYTKSLYRYNVISKDDIRPLYNIFRNICLENASLDNLDIKDRAIILKLLSRINSDWKSISYQKAISNFRLFAKDHARKEMKFRKEIDYIEILVSYLLFEAKHNK